MYLVTNHQLRPSIVCHEHLKPLLGFGQFDFSIADGEDAGVYCASCSRSFTLSRVGLTFGVDSTLLLLLFETHITLERPLATSIPPSLISNGPISQNALHKR